MSEVVGWVVVVLALLVGILMGYLCVRFRKLGIALLSCGGGVGIGFMITTTFLISNTYAYYCTIVACALALGMLAYCIEAGVIIGITSFLGSYSIVRGISLYAGGFPDEMLLHQ
jgi:hypothetical protein